MNEHQHSDQTDLDSLHAAVRREKPDAQPGQEPTPTWVFFATMVVVLLGGGYVGAYAPSFSFDTSNPFLTQPQDVRGLGPIGGPQLTPFQLAMKKGETVFNNCAGCHMVTGLGQPGAIPPLAGSEWVAGGTERIARIAMFGMAGPVTVKGSNFNNVMTPPPLSDQEIAYVLTYIRNSWGNSGHMVTKEMVTKVRAAVAGHVGPWNPADIQQYADKDIPGPIPDGPGATVPPPAAPGAAPAAGAPAPAPGAAVPAAPAPAPAK